MDRSIKVSLRIRQFNDCEIATEDRHKRSYSLDSTQRVITFGKGRQARHFMYDMIFTEDATQEDIGKINFGKNEKDNEVDKFLIIGYGQTGSGKTYTLTGDVWRANGILRKCLERFIDYDYHIWSAKMTIVQLY